MSVESTAMKALEKMQEQLRAEAEKRTKQLMRRAVPKVRSLENTLMAMTRQELDDIRYNIGISGTSGLNKAELVKRLAPEIVSFARSWLVSLVDEQYQAFRHLTDKGGLSKEFRADEMRLDYFQSIGVMGSGSDDGKLAWYLPDEIMEEFRKLDQGGVYAKMAELNTDALRVAAGVLFYYGVMDYDKLFAKVRQYLELDAESMGFSDFMGVMFNGSCWQKNIVTRERIAHYYTVVDPGKILEAQSKLGVGFAKLSYGQVYDAGEENYIEATNEYKALAQFFMAAYNVDVLRAAEIVGEITILFQNCGEMKDVLTYIESLGDTQREDDLEALSPLLIAFHNSLRLWTLKGHTPGELLSGKLDPEGGDVISFEAAKRKRGRVGRNDPCPCGSGKKYKNCCMRKDT